MSKAAKIPLKSGYEVHVQMGCDPELFLKRNGSIVGSERIFTEKILETKKKYAKGSGEVDPLFQVIPDGMQVEFNPGPATCRATLGGNLLGNIKRLASWLLTHYPEIEVDFSQVVDVTKEELEDLSVKSRVLGCAPSLNIYDQDATIGVNAETYLARSGGGHIHIGFYDHTMKTALQKVPQRIIQLMDILVGNTEVLLNRDPRAAERRQVYGRAGEYRLPTHGIEYRTPSNFWLQAYPLASLMWGLARLATALVYYQEIGIKEVAKKDPYGYATEWKTMPTEWEAELLKVVDIPSIRTAINENDFDLALSNWEGIRQFLYDWTDGMPEGVGDGLVPLVKSSLPDFDFVVKKGINHFWNPQQTLLRWLTIETLHGQGWEGFLVNQVRPQRLAEEKANKHLDGPTILREAADKIMRPKRKKAA